MQLTSSANIVTSGLEFYTDMYNIQSYRGPAITNLLPNGDYAGHPTINTATNTYTGWGTYHDRLYNSATYFSIGTIASVGSVAPNNNVVTCNNHPFKTGDVVRPQTTGGGVTAGTDYLVRAWDANTFSLYKYYEVTESYNIFDSQPDFNTDNRLAVTTSMTSMWWGRPHVPNSFLYKQIIKKGFQYQDRIHDCVRLHWTSKDGLCDGMAYGNWYSVTAGNTYTISFYYRAATPNAVGKQAFVQRWVDGEATNKFFTLSKEWQKMTHTEGYGKTGNLHLYWFNSTCPVNSAIDISEIMVYQNGGSSEYLTPGTSRSATETVYDLATRYRKYPRNTITASNLVYNDDRTFEFNGSSSNLSFSYTQANPNNFTVEAWIYHTAHSTDTNVGHCIVMPYSNYNGWILSLQGTSSKLMLRSHNAITQTNPYNFTSPTGLDLNKWYHVAATDDGTNAKLYVNGAVVATATSAAATTNGTMTCYIGSWSSSIATAYFKGKIPIVRIYSRGLTANEIAQNFDSHRARFGV